MVITVMPMTSNAPSLMVSFCSIRPGQALDEGVGVEGEGLRLHGAHNSG